MKRETKAPAGLISGGKMDGQYPAWFVLFWAAKKEPKKPVAGYYSRRRRSPIQLLHYCGAGLLRPDAFSAATRTIPGLLLVLALCCCLGSSCNRSPEHLGPRDYVRYMEDRGNELSRSITEGDEEYTIQLATPEYIASKEIGSAPGDRAGYRQRLDALKGNTFFIIHIGRRKGAAPLSANQLFAQARVAAQMELYYDQAAGADIRLSMGDRTLSPVTYHFENNYGLAPYNTIIAGFETGDVPAADMQLVFNDRYKDHPHIQAGFDRSRLQQLPSLSLN